MMHVRFQVAPSSLLQAALSYAQQQHWPVFPLAQAGKRPLTTHGLYDATTDVDGILRWWRAWPDANIGIPTGKVTGLVVLDVDPRHGGMASLEQVQHQYGSFPTTRTTQTGGGGWHFWYAYPPGSNATLKNATNLGGWRGLDLRGTGGYIVAPPSRHASGHYYRWVREEPLAPLPVFLMSLARPTGLPACPPSTSRKMERTAPGRNTRHMSRRDGSYWLHQALAKAMPGTRNATGFWLACQLRDNGVGFGEASSLLQQYAAEVSRQGDEPYTVQEALRSLSSAYQTPARPPARRPTTNVQSTQTDR